MAATASRPSSPRLQSQRRGRAGVWSARCPAVILATTNRRRLVPARRQRHPDTTR
ncbi:hypothetical protein HLY00_866 [Mycolicibacterium hippocampi]|uniref:Uncharacterized protein n=1 Tax=Mycolicibacterium hippocampi TaxID=659824 RepID=A0A850PTK8_9MYCO|nr:hypothetical protein [Mycolicibacterium hippocampi]